MESIPGNFNVHLAAIEAPGCTTTSAASRTVSLDCQVQASIHRFNDKLYTSPLAQREPSIDRQGTRCAAPCCQELVMLAKEVAGGWSWRYRQASGFTCADRNINPAPARKLQRDRQNILLRDVAIARTMSRSATAGRARPRGRADSRRRADYRQGRDSVWNGTSRHVRPDEQAVCAQSRAFVTRSVQVSRVLVARCDLAQCDLARPGVSAQHLRVSCALPVLPGSLRCWPLKRCSPVLRNSFSCFK